MTDETSTPDKALEQQLEAARRDYEDKRRALAWTLQKHFADGGDVTDRVLNAVDEYGREHALELLAERPDDYGVWEHASRETWREVTEGVDAEVARVTEAHDRLDELTSLADNRKADVTIGRTINIQGEAYVIDLEARELRNLSNGERHPIQAHDAAQDRKLTLTERAALRAQLPEQPKRREVRDRSRER